MIDTVTPETRSRIMATVKGKDTKPEVMLRKALFKRGFRYRLHKSTLIGKPDLVLTRYRAAIFINGCFWHWHGCKRSRLPSQNRAYWQQKIERNCDRDRKTYAELQRLGWRIIVVWECALRRQNLNSVVDFVDFALNGSIKMCVIEPNLENEVVCNIASSD